MSNLVFLLLKDRSSVILYKICDILIGLYHLLVHGRMNVLIRTILRQMAPWRLHPDARNPRKSLDLGRTENGFWNIESLDRYIKVPHLGDGSFVCLLDSPLWLGRDKVARMTSVIDPKTIGAPKQRARRHVRSLTGTSPHTTQSDSWNETDLAILGYLPEKDATGKEKVRSNWQEITCVHSRWPSLPVA